MKEKKAKPKRPTMPRISDEMKQWSAMLGEEIGGWPGVTRGRCSGCWATIGRSDIRGAAVTRAIGTPERHILRSSYDAVTLAAGERGCAHRHGARWDLERNGLRSKVQSNRICATRSGAESAYERAKVSVGATTDWRDGA